MAPLREDVYAWMLLALVKEDIGNELRWVIVPDEVG